MKRILLIIIALICLGTFLITCDKESMLPFSIKHSVRYYVDGTAKKVRIRYYDPAKNSSNGTMTIELSPPWTFSFKAQQGTFLTLYVMILDSITVDPTVDLRLEVGKDIRSTKSITGHRNAIAITETL